MIKRNINKQLSEPEFSWPIGQEMNVQLAIKQMNMVFINHST